jgi:hypothetical protein
MPREALSVRSSLDPFPHDACRGDPSTREDDFLVNVLVLIADDYLHLSDAKPGVNFFRNFSGFAFRFLQTGEPVASFIEASAVPSDGEIVHRHIG